jgi:hypothetical protein
VFQRLGGSLAHSGDGFLGGDSSWAWPVLREPRSRSVTRAAEARRTLSGSICISRLAGEGVRAEVQNWQIGACQRLGCGVPVMPMTRV